MLQGPVKKDKKNNPFYICRWKNNVPRGVATYTHATHVRTWKSLALNKILR